MKKTHSVFLVILSFSVVLMLMTGCFRPAAPDVTPTPGGGAEAATPGGSDLEMTAIANSTRAAQTLEAQTAEAEAPGDEEEPTEEEPTDEPTEPATAPAATATPASVTGTEPAPTATPEMVTEATATPVPALPTATTPPSTGDGSGTTTYVVQASDPNLFRIAQRYGISWQRLAAYNGIGAPYVIYPGMVLQIPPQ